MLISEDKKTSAQYNKLLSRVNRKITVIDVKSQVINIDEIGIPFTTSIDRATPVTTREHPTKKLISNLCSLLKVTVLRNGRIESTKPLQYAVNEVVDYRHTSKDVMYKVRW